MWSIKESAICLHFMNIYCQEGLKYTLILVQENEEVEVTGTGSMSTLRITNTDSIKRNLRVPKTLWWQRKHLLAWTCRQHLAQDIKELVPSSPIYEFEGRGSVFSPLEVKHISGIRGFVFCPHLERWTKEVVSPTETGTASLSICKDLKKKIHHSSLVTVLTLKSKQYHYKKHLTPHSTDKEPEAVSSHAHFHPPHFAPLSSLDLYRDLQFI